jgi:hypothetical protein
MPNAPVGPPDASRTPRYPGIANATDRERLIEQHSIDCIPSSERHGTLWHQAPFGFLMLDTILARQGVGRIAEDKARVASNAMLESAAQ